MQKKTGTLSVFEQKLRIERRNAHTAKNMAEALVNSIGEGLIIVNEYGIITHINQIALDMLGYKKGELEGRWFPKAVPSKDRKGNDIPASERVVVRALVTGARASEVGGFMRKDGTIVEVAGTASPFLIKDRPKGAIIIFRDVSKELQIERAKDEFISLVSHQMRTPLTSISLFSEMLATGQAGSLNRKQKEYAEKINLSAARMIRLVGNILNLSRIELGRLKVQPVEVDLVPMIKNRVEEVRPVAEAKNIKLSFAYSQSPSQAVADPVLLGQVIHNLLSNSIRYTLADQGVIKVQLKKIGRAYEFSISDNGIGIPSKAQSRVFERFFRADNAMNIAGEGTGLGLYLAKMIIKDSGGKIWFKSKEGQGTTFYILIPAAKPPEKKIKIKEPD